ncbi:MAG TPA: hypothetical protein VH877_29930 [Polyangia bacterium]|jgi:hypothetical protein|nr:hypothetical protein [Polyangia bacterium]
MLLRIEYEKRPQGWLVEARGVPGTSSEGTTCEEALAGTLRKLADKAAHHELRLPMDVLIAEAPPPGLPAFTGADLLALWRSLPHGDSDWADEVDRAAHAQPALSEEPSPWER